MRIIIDYQVIDREYSLKLERLVKEAIYNGWEPLGGICINENGEYSQAMVKYKEMNDEIDR